MVLWGPHQPLITEVFRIRQCDLLLGLLIAAYTGKLMRTAVAGEQRTHPQTWLALACQIVGETYPPPEFMNVH